MSLYGIRGNAGWTVKPFDEDMAGWIEADFIFEVRDNGTVQVFKNRKTGVEVEFLNVDSFMRYVKDFYDFSCEGVCLDDMSFLKIPESIGLRERRMWVRELTKSRNKDVVYKNFVFLEGK